MALLIVDLLSVNEGWTEAVDVPFGLEFRFGGRWVVLVHRWRGVEGVERKFF